MEHTFKVIINMHVLTAIFLIALDLFLKVFFIFPSSFVLCYCGLMTNFSVVFGFLFLWCVYTYYRFSVCSSWGFNIKGPDGSNGKETACNAGVFGSAPGSESFSHGEGNGNPLKYSYLKNSKDRGAWHTTVHVVTKSGTKLDNEHVYFDIKVYI